MEKEVVVAIATAESAEVEASEVVVVEVIIEIGIIGIMVIIKKENKHLQR